MVAVDQSNILPVLGCLVLLYALAGIITAALVLRGSDDDAVRVEDLVVAVFAAAWWPLVVFGRWFEHAKVWDRVVWRWWKR